MHIFLTGEIQIGKSTVIAKTLALLDKSHGGFQTYFGPDRGTPNRFLYMNSASEQKVYREENKIVRFTGGNPEVVSNIFDTYGVELIRVARAKSKVIIMDECGSFESNAVLFQKEIMDTLEGDIPVFGVVKLLSTGWTDKIRNHQKVKLITVTRENRDNLPRILTEIFYSNDIDNK